MSVIPIVSTELDYTPKTFNHSQIVTRNVAPQGSSSLTTSVTSTTGPTTFIIPGATCFNLAKSRLNFSLLVPADGAKCNFVNGNLLTAISRITLYDSATNALWCDISNVNSYASMVVPAGTSFTEYATKSWLQTVNQTVANARTNTVEDIAKSNVSSENDSGDNADIGVQNPFFSRRQWYIGAATQAVALDVSIPLSAFKMSILSSDKLMFVPSNLNLDIYWSANNSYAHIATAVTSPSVGQASLAAPIDLSNISLGLAAESNPIIVNDMTTRVMSSGMQLPFAYPSMTRQALASASAHSYQLSVTKGYGSRILAFITCPFSASANPNLANVHNRGNITTYNTFLQNIAIKSQAGFDATKSQDFYGNRDYLEGSVIQTIGEYRLAEWIHVDSYFGERPLHEVDQHVIDGLDLKDTPTTWSIQVNLSADTALNYSTLIVGQKILSLSSQGSMVM